MLSFIVVLKGHTGSELRIFLVHLESIYYLIFFCSKIVLNCVLQNNYFRPKCVGFSLIFAFLVVSPVIYKCRLLHRGSNRNIARPHYFVIFLFGR